MTSIDAPSDRRNSSTDVVAGFLSVASIVLSLFALVSYTGALTALNKVPDLVFAARRDMLAREYFPSES